MWIKRFRVESFSSFKDSGWIDLSPKFNMFIGQNNSGKSALLSSLSAPMKSNPHKSEERFLKGDLKESLVSLDIAILVEEIFQKFSEINVPPSFPAADNNQTQRELVESYLNRQGRECTLNIYLNAANSFHSKSGSSIHELTESAQYSFSVTRESNKYIVESAAANVDNLARIVSQPSLRSVFFFSAQRLNLAKSPWSNPPRLTNDASNLASVLATLQGQRRLLFDRIEHDTLSVLSGLERITVAPRESGTYEILGWPRRDTDEESLAFSLDNCGTGVGQVLAIITAVATSRSAIIVIDEINSFLHPGAVKKLLTLLRTDYGHHQYIISSHSADAIASCNAEKLFLVTRSGYVSQVQEIATGSADRARLIAGNLGFSMMDVFGFDRVIWVEGPTEEICFPFLAKRRRLEVPDGLGFVSVSSPSMIGSPRTRDKAILDIYDRAGRQLAPLIKGMAFSLDRERLSDEEVQKQERSKRKLKILPRRCFECYLLRPAAIAQCISRLDGRLYTGQQVHDHFVAVGADPKFGGFPGWEGSIEDSNWLKRIDGAKVISDVFQRLTDNRVEYRKTRDAIDIMRWIEDNEPNHLDDLTEYLRKILEISGRDTAP